MNGEGYVKYRLIHEDGPAPGHPQWQALNDLRSDLVKAGLVGALENGVGFGNVSLRAGEEGAFVISATATGHIPRLTPEHYALVSRCDIVGNTVWSCGPARASSESMTHAAVYGAAPGIGCVVHAHHRGLYEQLLAGKAPATDPGAAYGTPAMALSVAALVRAHPADGVIAMTGHQDGFLLYAPGVEHMRDLLAMLAQGYIPC
ncbi:class II aldolase/adducin family protein [uncultured Mailhella sp.]|uniref:class II aldolase/adducin family protein n=1 Tax=uncultured Mailhella sp. TaxID=1981031 RepID=UPI00262318C9|nr:class II aldolase/adducin family protein [uncultured Mailhella sp.]